MSVKLICKKIRTLGQSGFVTYDQVWL